jgi:hypothetical protein
VSVLQAEGNFLGLGACLQDYDLRICTNYKDILDSAKEPPRGTLKNWFAPYVLVITGMVYNTKEASKPGLLPTRTCSIRNTKERVGIPAYGKVGNSWLQVLNKTLGGNEDDIDPGIAFLVELIKKNQPLIVENADAGLKGLCLRGNRRHAVLERPDPCPAIAGGPSRYRICPWDDVGPTRLHGMALMATIERIPPNLEEATQNLGANWYQMFRCTILPLSLPGLISGSLLVYSISISGTTAAIAPPPAPSALTRGGVPPL